MPPQHPPTAVSSHSKAEDEHKHVRKEEIALDIAPRINYCFVEGDVETQV